MSPEVDSSASNSHYCSQKFLLIFRPVLSTYQSDFRISSLSSHISLLILHFIVSIFQFFSPYRHTHQLCTLFHSELIPFLDLYPQILSMPHSMNSSKQSIHEPDSLFDLIFSYKCKSHHKPH